MRDHLSENALETLQVFDPLPDVRNVLLGDALDFGTCHASVTSEPKKRVFWRVHIFCGVAVAVYLSRSPGAFLRHLPEGSHLVLLSAAMMTGHVASRYLSLRDCEHMAERSLEKCLGARVACVATEPDPFVIVPRPN